MTDPTTGPSSTPRPPSLPVIESSTTRRDFFRLASSMALAGVGACGQPPAEKIISYTRTPKERVPGVPVFYATTMALDGDATGLLVESHEGRPTKVEGNPDHPASLGGTRAIHQASVLDLYDPLRADRITEGFVPRGWEDLMRALNENERRTRGMHFLLEPVSSPTTAALLDRLRARYPEARIAFHTASSMSPATEGARVLFGEASQPVYDFTRAERIVALDADFIDGMPYCLRYARDFASRRRIAAPDSTVNRLYVAEPTLTPTGSLADERVACQARSIAVLVAVLLRETLGTAAAQIRIPESARELLARPQCAPDVRPWLLAAAADLREHAGRSVVVVGPRQPWPVHLMAALLNSVLGNVDRTVRYVPPTTYSAGDAEQSVDDLLEDMHAGRVRQLLISGTNPVYTMPPEAGVEAALARVDQSIRHADYRDETARVCRWMIPRLHYLESWGDARAWDGTVSMIQPLVAPLHSGVTLDQILAGLLGERRTTPHALLHDFWRGTRLRPGASTFEDFMELALQQGHVRESAPDPIAVRPRSDAVTGALEALADDVDPGAIEVNFHLDAKVHDGRFATNPWLQELPDPNTKLTWGNAVLVSTDLVRELDLEPEQVVEVELAGQRVQGPVATFPGMAPRSIALALGYGRTAVPEEFAVGFDAFAVRPGPGTGFASGARVRKTTERRALAPTQEHFSVHDRELALHTTLEAFRENAEHLTEDLRGPVEHLFMLDKPHDPPQWGMVIDLTLCSGCSACVVACMAENNVPTVGKDGVRRGREMHWLRIDRYYEGEPNGVTTINQPMLCQHCDRAPCEYVCPVNATVHEPDGLNAMIYNRCIGTRFCSNNCPYKVRRFNFFKYADTSSRALQKNPDVTVRDRGVMEKCTYCVQRLRRAEIDARRRMMPVSSIPVETACQQACPTRAIAFGDITNEASEVRSWWGRPQRYEVLHHTGTEPRTQYLAKIINLGPKVS